MEKTNEILTIAGERVEVRYESDYYEACDKCRFHNIFVGCNVRALCHGCPCEKYSDHENRRFAYFVPAEDGEADTTAQAQLIPAEEGKILPKLREFLATATPEELEAKYRELEYLLAPKGEDEGTQKAAENSEIIFSTDGELTIYSFVGAPRWWATIREAEEALSVFKAGAKYERKRMMKEAVECNVIWYDGRLLDFTQQQLDAALDKIGAGVDAKVSVIIVKKEK